MQRIYRVSFLVFPLLFLTIVLQGQRILFDSELEDSGLSREIINIKSIYEVYQMRAVSFSGLDKEPALRLKLFDDKEFLVNYVRTETFSTGGTAWVGRIKDQPASSIVFAESKGIWSGRLEDEGGNRYLLLPTSQAAVYNLVALGGDYIDEGLDEVVNPLQEHSSELRNSASVCDAVNMCTAKRTIDLLVVYTTEVTANQGGTAAVEAAITAIIADLNMINANSDVIHCFNLKHVEEINYIETTNSSTDLSWVATDATVDALRNAHGADLVGLITNASAYCGLGHTNTNPTTYTAANAFSVSSWSCAGANRTFAHEIGHNLGLQHDRATNTTNLPCAEAHGYVNQAALVDGAAASKRWRTIMAYNDQCTDLGFACTRIPYWSNPTILYDGSAVGAGDPMGSTTSSAEANASFILSRAACLVADFKEQPICPQVIVFDENATIYSGALATEILTWQTSITAGSINSVALASATTNASIEYSTALLGGAVTVPNGAIANGIHSGASSQVETQKTYAYLKCFGADAVMGGTDDTYFLLGTHTLSVKTAEFKVDNTGGSTNGANVFMGEDPCSCNEDQVLNMDGTVSTPGTFSEVVTITGPANLFVRVKTITDAAGNSFKLTENTLTEDPMGSGTYKIPFKHKDRLGYSITAFEFASTLTGNYTIVTSGAPAFTPVKISNVCAYPRVVGSPLASTLRITDTPINLTLTELSTDVSFTGTTQFTINGTPATVFNPASAPVIVGTNSVAVTYDITAGSGRDGTLAAPAIPIDGSGAGVCPITLPFRSVQVSTDIVPTMSQWGLMIFGLLILNLGLFFVRRIVAISSIV